MSWGGQKFFCDPTYPDWACLGTHRHPWVLPNNLVTFYVKISEIAMAKLTCISLPLVESQSFCVDAGVT